jgi:alkanesulfonate monooxygenase SsuD/methylene tetrahydromethanopterin reductase-like flavin-dependent oxidoreductase (luciferase family)
MGRSVEATAEHADGWLPVMFVPERFQQVWGDQLKAGLAKRPAARPRLDIGAGGLLAIGEDLVGDEAARVLDSARPHAALYIGGMGARGKNFYNDIMRRYGYEAEAIEIQDLYLDGRKADAATAVPAEYLELSNLVGPPSYIRERIGAYREAGVTVLSVNPVGPDPVKTVETLKQIITDASG